MSKRLTAAVITALLLTSASAQTTLKMTIWGGKSDQTLYQKRIDAFQKVNPDIKIQLMLIPSDYDQKVQTMVVGGTPPDIMQVAEQYSVFASKNQLVPLDDLLSAQKVNLATRYGANVAKTYTFQGKTYAVPDRGGSLIVYYNKDQFKAAGVKPPTASWTWQDLISAAQKLTVTKDGKVTQYGFTGGDWWPFWLSFVYQNGGHILDASGKPDFNTPATAQALQTYQDMVYKYKVVPSPKDYADLGGINGDTLFAQGKAAILITGFWTVSSSSQVKGLNFDIAPMWRGKERAAIPFGSGLAIAAGSKNQEAAAKAIAFLTSPQGQQAIVDDGSDIPTNKALLSSKAFLSAASLPKKVDMKALTQNQSAIVNLPLVPQWNEMQKVFGDNISQLLLNKTNGQQTAANIQQGLERLFR